MEQERGIGEDSSIFLPEIEVEPQLPVERDIEEDISPSIEFINVHEPIRPELVELPRIEVERNPEEDVYPNIEVINVHEPIEPIPPEFVDVPPQSASSAQPRPNMYFHSQNAGIKFANMVTPFMFTPLKSVIGFCGLSGTGHDGAEVQVVRVFFPVLNSSVRCGCS